jgi:hypothetical protein
MRTTKMVLWRRSLHNIQQPEGHAATPLLNVNYLLESEIIILASAVNRLQSTQFVVFGDEVERCTCNNMTPFVGALLPRRASVLR